MNLKESFVFPALPISLIPCNTSQQIKSQEEYLQHLKEALQWVMGNMEAVERDINLKYLRREECERMLEEKEQVITALKNENYELRVLGEQLQRSLRRHQLKQKQLNNQLYHLGRTIQEKEAIIKYLEAKTAPQSSSLFYSRPLNESNPLQDCSRVYSKPNLTFANLKSSPCLMKFEDYANTSLQPQAEPTKRSKNDRVRTESSDAKENEAFQNLRPLGTHNLSNFLKNGMLGSFEDQRTLTKDQQSTSFCKQVKLKRVESKDNRRRSNLGKSFLPQFYRE